MRLERNFHLLADFRSQVNFLRKFRILSLDEIYETVASPRKKQGQAVALTFDDGYANNLVATEILTQLRLPWTVFISTGAVGRERAIWTNELSLLLLHGRAPKIEFDDNVWQLQTRAEREVAFQSIRFHLKSLSFEKRVVDMKTIHEQFPEGELQRLLHRFPSMQMLNWREIEELSHTGVVVGSHGITHEIHHEAQSVAVRKKELVESKTELEKRLSYLCQYFAFPNGNFVSTSSHEVHQAGYKLAFSMQSYCNVNNHNTNIIPRVELRKV